MRFLKNLVVILALVSALPMSVAAQSSEKNIVCNDKDCVFEVLNKLKSNDKAVVTDAENTILLMAENTANANDKDTKQILRKSMTVFVFENENCASNDYLISLFPVFCNENDIADIYRLINNERLADAAIRALADMPDTRDYFEKYMVKNPNYVNHKAAMAYAAGKQEITSLENELISWLKRADESTKIEIYKALVVIRSNDKTTSIVEKGAKKLYKSKNVDTKIASMKILVAVQGEKSLSMLYKSLKNKDKRVRVAALELMKPFANQEVCAKTVKICVKNNATVEVLNWLGDIKNDSQMEFVINQLTSEDTRVAEAAIRAIFKIDNPDGIAAVKPMVGGKYQEVIKESMLSYEGDYAALMNDMLRGNDQLKLAALQILEERPNVATNRKVKELLNANNKIVSDEAYKVLKYVVTPADAAFLSALLETCGEKYVEDVQLAIKNAMANAPENVKNNFASTLKHVKPNIMPRFYKVFAYFGTELTVDKLIEAYETGDYKKDAKEALLLVKNKAYADRIAEVLKN
jgi:HEAT repeat protein